LTVAVLASLGGLGVTSIAALLAVTTLVNATASLGRFVLLRRWMAPPSTPNRMRGFGDRSEAALRNGHEAARHD
jgi:hypothetical protein